MSRPGRALAYKGDLAVKRVSNWGSMSGLTVDGATVTKAGGQVFVTSGVGVAVTYGTFEWLARLSDVVNYTEFTALYDRYQIAGVRLVLTPYATSVATGAAASGSAQQGSVIIHSVIDLDDAAALAASEAGIDAIRQYKTYRTMNPYQRGGRTWKRYIRPKLAMGVYNGAAFAGYRQIPWGWTDCQNPAIEGYGLKAVVEVLGGGSTISYTFKGEATFYMKFRDPR